MSVVQLRHRYQITRIAQFRVQGVDLLTSDGGSFGPKELGEAGWRVVSTFEGPGQTQQGVGNFLWALWERTED